MRYGNEAAGDTRKIRISITMHTHSVLGLGPFCTNYCLDAAWRGCYQLWRLRKIVATLCTIFEFLEFHLWMSSL